jgi:hypothetical protein
MPFDRLRANGAKIYLEMKRYLINPSRGSSPFKKGVAA